VTVAKLTLADISDLRAYERERDGFRARVMELKRRRRLALGPLVSVLFENRDTVRYQIQEMARAERMLSDEQVQAELDIYNPLVPEAGELSLTLFLELTSEEELREWLPKLVGIERSLRLEVGGVAVPGEPETAHEESLTREEVTASVHYVGFSLGAGLVRRFAADPVELALDHPSYSASAPIEGETKESLLGDLEGIAGLDPG
jgi:hypothetical protein